MSSTRSQMALAVARAQPGSGLAVGMSREARARAFRAASRHSLLVRLLRIVFPLAALGMLALYILPSRLSVDVGGAQASLDGVDVDAGNLKMINPSLKGMHAKYGRYVIKAATATQNIKTPNRIRLDKIHGEVVSLKGEKTILSAPSGLFENKKELLMLDRGALITGASGLNIKLHTARILFPQQLVQSDQPVEMHFGANWITAQSLRLNTGDGRAVFGGRVRVHLERKKDEAKAQ